MPRSRGRHAYSIPHWIIEEEVAELPDTRKRVGFCDSQEDAELIIAAPKLEQQVADLLAALRAASGTINPRHCKGCEIAFTEVQQAIADVEKGVSNEQTTS